MIRCQLCGGGSSWRFHYDDTWSRNTVSGGLQSHVCPHWPRYHTCHTEYQSVCCGACNWFHVSIHVKGGFLRWVSSVSIVTGIPAGRMWSWDAFRDISKRFSSSQQHSDWFCGPPSPLSNWASGFFVRGKVARLKANRSPLSTAWSYTAYVHSAIDVRTNFICAS